MTSRSTRQKALEPSVKMVRVPTSASIRNWQPLATASPPLLSETATRRERSNTRNLRLTNKLRHANRSRHERMEERHLNLLHGSSEATRIGPGLSRRKVEGEHVLASTEIQVRHRQVISCEHLRRRSQNRWQRQCLSSAVEPKHLKGFGPLEQDARLEARGDALLHGVSEAALAEQAAEELRQARRDGDEELGRAVEGLGVGRAARRVVVERRVNAQAPGFLYASFEMFDYDGPVGIDLRCSRRSPSKMTISFNLSERILLGHTSHAATLKIYSLVFGPTAAFYQN